MPADLSVLVPSFKTNIDSLLRACANRGCVMRPYVARRDPLEQARLWRQSRSIEEINQKVADLNARGATFIAQCVVSAGPQAGPRVTNALPGFSWHQWDEAIDCFWLVGQAAEWSSRKLINGVNGYQVLADEAGALGLTAGGHFSSLKDWPHVQLRRDGSPEGAMSLAEINAGMKQKFGK